MHDDYLQQLREQRNVARRRLAKAEQRDRELHKDIKTLDRLGELLDIEFEDMTMAELVETRNALQRSIEILPQSEPRVLLNIVEAVIKAHQALNIHMQQHSREDRIFVKKLVRALEDTPTQLDHLCIVCQNRPRHFEDYCKRCVPEELRPKGKIQ